MEKIKTGPDLIYFNNLNTLRFICFLMVFFFHSFYTVDPVILDSSVYKFIKRDVFGNGNIGVNIFFVLSGFLITYLLIVEKEKYRSIRVDMFWMRRILRIWPLYFFCVFFGFVIFPFIKMQFGETPNETASLWSYLTFTNNFDFIRKGLPDASILGVLWSIAVEEQFYFLWPLMLMALPAKRFPYLFLLVILGSIIFRIVYKSEIMHEHHTLSCMGDLSVGALFAWLAFYSHTFVSRVKKMSRLFIAVIYLAFIGLFIFRDELAHVHFIIPVFDRLVIAILSGLIIIEQCFSDNSFFKLGRIRWMSKLGEWTYGMYCLHFIAILVALKLNSFAGLNSTLWGVVFADTLLSLGLTILISWFSYRFFESYFLKFKSRYSRT